MTIIADYDKKYAKIQFYSKILTWVFMKKMYFCHSV